MSRFETDTKDYLGVVGPILRTAWACLHDPGSMFVFCSTGEVVDVAVAIGQRLRRMLWMYKPADVTFPLAGWLLTSEAILWFTKGKISLRERHPYAHDCYVVNRIGTEGRVDHPAAKPLPVVYDIASRCPEGGLVLDPFAGSGTTLVAAYRLGLRAVGIEISERFCEVAAQRLEREITAGINAPPAAQGQLALR